MERCALASIALKVCASCPSSSVERTSSGVVTALRLAREVAAPRRPRGRRSASVRQCSSRLRRRVISPRTGPTTLRVIDDREARRRSAARRPSRSAAAASVAARVGLDAVGGRVACRRSIDVLQRVIVADSSSVCGRDLAGVEVARARRGPRPRRRLGARRRIASSSRALPRALPASRTCASSAVPLAELVQRRRVARRVCADAPRSRPASRSCARRGRRRRRRGARRSRGRSPARAGRPGRRRRDGAHVALGEPACRRWNDAEGLDGEQRDERAARRLADRRRRRGGRRVGRLAKRDMWSGSIGSRSRS